MLGTRDWVEDDSPSGTPQVIPDEDGPLDKYFLENDSTGVSVCIKFDKYSFPKDLNWVGMSKASAWMKVLRLKTALGAIKPTKNLKVFLDVIDKNGQLTQQTIEDSTYLWIDETSDKSLCYKDIENKRDELYKKGRNPDDLPKNFTNRFVIYDKWDYDALIELNKSRKFLNEDDIELLNIHKPFVYCAYVWSVNHWNEFHDDLEYRASKSKILHGGIQLAANNMPQGEKITIPLGNNISRQNNAHILIHFENYTPDLGRKNYKKELVELAQKIASRLVDVLFKHHKCLKPATGGRSRDGLFRKQRIDDWKKEMEEYEKSNPLNLINENFFIPTKKISITSIPSREQDVIALFNQMVAGGVIRGIKVMATNERSDYDGLYRVTIDHNPLHIYDKDKNPLGIPKENLKVYESQGATLPFQSAPKVLEYKFSLDGLIENVGTGVKNSKDIDLIIVWETGEEWKKNYRITTTLHEDYLDDRHYHGVTHRVYNINTNEEGMDMIVLKELIEYLNDPISTQEKQLQKYEDYDD